MTWTGRSNSDSVESEIKHQFTVQGREVIDFQHVDVGVSTAGFATCVLSR